MTMLILIVQGAFTGYMAGIAFGTGIEFSGAVGVNSLFINKGNTQ